ncbi:methionine ABC transporter ATP-binding protein [Corynebacterium pseudotuberculosis]|uniref:ATP-binding cassette domain-containing protein n=1 Tax=Corynebacterium pseudotuberculosis (strain C231) TaxID=681645 RepID=D9QEK4_CORP2|nr:methionine ABC transporter ATP-binding protein [Corynebacterium pseudotuberculosis]ADK28231.1 ATP-binding cassette domain-containing protein [Corynebacterium pseudotuberculosis FRC41]ADL09927.1 ATP-binding cassette domain-containing protein [Corynebacterium pseudotuberculosis C231]ADL20333.1 methionine ABC transporter ATP-binding protein [Corynebacterium pseudotuberculosis 1002]ADO25719.1 ATP-binding cassette domain-containing protein [Corynebacterium pseudotuberculosis I19]AEK91771.1 Methi
MNGTRIEFEDITKVFSSGKKNITALDGVTLTVEPGEILGVIGYSGAGKSTLVRMINGLDFPTSGHLRLDGTDIVGMPEKKLRSIRAGIGMIFQQFNLFTSRTAAGNIEYPLKLAGVDKQERKKRVDELLTFVGLSDRGGNYPEELSGGQKQRVGIARALANNPALLLADEATSALDPETTHEVLDLLRKVNRELGITIVVITHEMDVIRSIADKVAVMESGKVVEYGSVYEVFSHPQTRVAQRFVATSLRNTPDAIESEDLLAHEGRLFTITLSEDSGFFTAAAQAKDAGAGIGIVHGGITTLQKHSFGKVTVRLTGPDNVIDSFFDYLSTTTDIQEIQR